MLSYLMFQFIINIFFEEVNTFGVFFSVDRLFHRFRILFSRKFDLYSGLAIFWIFLIKIKNHDFFYFLGFNRIIWINWVFIFSKYGQ